MKFLTALVLTASSLLASCGGGGGGGSTSNPSPVISLGAFAGKWTDGCPTNSNVKDITTFTAEIDGSLSVSESEDYFSAAGCTGLPVASGSYGAKVGKIVATGSAENVTVTLADATKITANVVLINVTSLGSTFSWTGQGVVSTSRAAGASTAILNLGSGGTITVTRSDIPGGQVRQGALLIRNGQLLSLLPVGSSTTAFTVDKTFSSNTEPVSCFGGVKPSTTPYPQVTMVTSKGTVVVELYPLNAPATVANFLQYVTDGFYKDKIFHRVISNFVIQGGGFDAQLNLAANRAPIALEVCNGLSNTRGTIAMARTSVLNSATSQFFINVVDNTALDTSGGGYAVFGKVVSGMDVVDLIKAVPTQTVNGFGSDVPVTPITITSATRTQ